MPKISVVMPVYNAEKYLREAMDSILAQTLGDFEFIIIDDGSTDASAEIVRSYSDARIRFYQNERNMGVAATLNRGLDLATGEYIARMDADDISLPERFAKQAAYLDAHPECAALGCDMELFGAQIGTFAHAHTAGQLKVDLLFASALGHPTVMMRSTVVGREGLHYDEAYNGIEDYELWVRVAEKYDLGNLPEILLRYRMHAAQVTQNHTERYEQMHRELKTRQTAQLGIPSEGSGFDAFARFCCRDRNQTARETADLIVYLSEIKKANRSKRVYQPVLLDRSLDSLKNSALARFSLPEIRTIFRDAKMPVFGYLIRRAIRGRVARAKTKIRQLKCRRGLRNRDFTIISNNCWGGLISEKYGLRKNSPTCGLLILGEDYLRFCGNLREYLQQKLTFISWEDAKHHGMFPGQRFPVAMLGDIEIYFMHYPDEQISAEKWYRRCKRVNWDNLIFKISERETFTPELIGRFAQLDLPNHLIFASQQYSDDTIVVPGISTLQGDETPLIEQYFREDIFLNQIRKG